MVTLYDTTQITECLTNQAPFAYVSQKFDYQGIYHNTIKQGHSRILYLAKNYGASIPVLYIRTIIYDDFTNT